MLVNPKKTNKNNKTKNQKTTTKKKKFLIVRGRKKTKTKTKLNKTDHFQAKEEGWRDPGSPLLTILLKLKRDWLP